MPTQILTLDPKTLEYRDQQKVRYDSLGMARNIDDVAERICTTSEWRALAGLSSDERRRRAALTFSAKECVHKAWAPISGVTLPFDAVEIELLSASRFRVHPLDPRLAAWPSTCWSGWYGIADGTVGTLLQLTAE